MSFARRKVMAALSRRGFKVLREGGGHTVVEGPEGQQLPVPRHTEISRGTARSIARQARVEWKNFQREIS